MIELLGDSIPMRARKIQITLVVLILLFGTALPARKAAKGSAPPIQATDLRQWLTYLASDELEGRRTFSEGLGLAAAYIAGELKSMGVKPGGDNGSYFQRVAVLGVKSTNRSSLTVEVNGRKRTFRDGEGVSFPRNVGGKRSFSTDAVEFVGYGLDAPLAKHNDYAGVTVRDKVAVWLGQRGPAGLDARTFRRALLGRSRYAIEQGALASIGQGFSPANPGNPREATEPAPSAPSPRSTETGAGAQPGQGQAPARTAGAAQPAVERPDFTTPQRLDSPVTPSVSARDEFFEFLFSAAPVSYAELKSKADRQESLAPFALKNVRLTFDLDADYELISTQYTRNVVGIVEGSDAKVKNTYVAFGAHYDHVGYAEGEVRQTPNGLRRAGAVGRVQQGALEDRVWNGADDDGSGSVVLLGVARALARGPRLRRSALFVWHSGEERGLWGSRYFIDHASVPVASIVTQLNLDMVGRNENDDAAKSDTVYLVGSDRISTELHNISVDANEAIERPLKLDYTMNDPADLEQVYFRSDHYSYAAKGIPIIFFTTGLHADYHSNTDSVEKINFEKMTRIAELVAETGRRVANLDYAPARDNRGPRMGKGGQGKL